MSPPPDFVLFITDQQRADFLGCYGHPVLETPHIDGIAARGTCFDRFYVASPVCMPNRASLMTGRMPSAHHVKSNGVPLPVRSTTFVDLLRDAGYFTALIGKSHLQNFTGRPPRLRPPAPAPGRTAPRRERREAFRHDLDGARYEQEGPEFWSRPEARVQTPFYGFDHVELCTGHGDRVGGSYRHWLLERRPDAAGLIGPEHQLDHELTCPQAWRTALPVALHPSTYVAERAAALIGGLPRRRDRPPFFLMVSFPDPHHPFSPPGRYWDLYRPESMPAPPAFGRNDPDQPPYLQALLEERRAGTANVDGMAAFAVTEREAREAQALTCGMIGLVDDCVGRVLAALEAAGAGERTVVVFTSDHGDFLGDHQLLLKGPAHYQGLIRVPCVWSDPETDGGGNRADGIASTIDLPATVLERARLEPYAGLQGKSFLGLVGGGGTRHRDAVLVEEDQQRLCFGFEQPPRVHSVVTERWRLSLYHGVPWGELYDLEEDPGEFRNLWHSDRHQAIRAALLERLARLEIEHVDRTPLPTGQA